MPLGKGVDKEILKLTNDLIRKVGTAANRVLLVDKLSPTEPGPCHGAMIAYLQARVWFNV